MLHQEIQNGQMVVRPESIEGVLCQSLWWLVVQDRTGGYSDKGRWFRVTKDLRQSQKRRRRVEMVHDTDFALVFLGVKRSLSFRAFCL